ncbi:long-chain fatty acid--CoA ligase [Rhodococcus olei]|uniref:Long-chain fatty acid--CoA ligase n=1 Tax=Rhodococcus olei TaxID=2161675 RepID=A0ABP8NYP5_9NOCA
MSATVSHALRWWAKERSGQDALVVGDDSLTYRELEHWTSRIARRLGELGVEPGDRVGVVGLNSMQWAAAALGIVKYGAILVPLNNRFKRRELAGILEDMTPALVLGDEAFAEVIDGLSAGDGRTVTFAPLSSLDELREGEPDDFRRDRDPADPMIIMMTSGSTGRPKGVVYTNAGLLGMMFEWSLMEETIRPGVRIFLPTPFAFAPGTVWGLMRAITFGGTLVFQQRFDPAEAVRLLEKHAVHVSLGGPMVYEQMAKTAEFETAVFPHLRTAITGGARVDIELLEKWMAKGLPIRQLYGMSEVGGITTATSAPDAFDHPDTCGRGGIFSEFKVIRPDGTECDPGEQGEIVSRGPGVMAGYWNAPEQTAATLRDGWVHGSDAGVVTEDGRLKFVDRVKDIIISGGINISPAEIESVIAAIAGVEEVVVLGARDEKYGEVPAAVVRLADGATTVDEVLEVCRRELADFKIPRFVIARDTPLPRLAHGKLNKVEIRDEYCDLADRFEPVAAKAAS